MPKDFSKDVDKFILEFNKGSEQTIRGTTIKLWGAIIAGTPVDEGRARGGWLAGFEPKSDVPDSLDPSGASTTTNAASSVLRQVNWSKFTLYNNLPYIEKLEFGGYGDGPKTIGGYSKQAPAGFVRVNVSRFSRILEADAARALPK